MIEKSKENLKNTKVFKFCLLKRYFDTGWAISTPVKYGIALFGLSSLDVTNTLLMGVTYANLCFILGYLWYEKGFAIAMAEVSNQYDLFIKEMRASLKNKRFK